MTIKSERKHLRLLAIMSVILIASFILAPQFMEQDTSATQQISASLTSADYTLTVDAASSIYMEITATANGSYASAKDTINVYTNAENGYQLFIQSESSNKMFLENNSDAYLSPTAGTFKNPKVLSENSWGFALTQPHVNELLTRHGGTDLAQSGAFDDSYSTPVPSAGSKWAAMSTSAQLIGQNTSATAKTGENIDIFYGAYATSVMHSGKYSNTTTYTAIADTTSTHQGDIEVSPTNITDFDETITIKTDIATKMEDLGKITITIDDVSCKNISTDLSTGFLVITCTAPAHRSDNDEDYFDNGAYKLNVNLAKFVRSYTKDITYSIWHTKTLSTPNLFTITNMQQMTSATCANTPTPLTDISSTTTTASNNKYSPEELARYIPQASLKDTRDNRSYVIRKLSDGHCWMAEELRLGAVQINSSTSDYSGTAFTLPTPQTSGTTAWKSSISFLSDDISSYDNLHIYQNDSYGSLYNYYTATAKSGTSTTAEGTISNYSICPKNWQLPSAEVLDNILVGSTWDPKLINGFDPGPNYYYANGAMIGHFGYWGNKNGTYSSTASFPYSNAYELDNNGIAFKTLNVGTQSKFYGYYVRCIAR